MITYYCYQIWEFLKHDVVELKFENDKEAYDYWFGLYKDHRSDVCLSIARLVEVDGVRHEEFVALIKCSENGVQSIKSQAL